MRSESYNRKLKTYKYKSQIIKAFNKSHARTILCLSPKEEADIKKVKT